MPSPITAFLIGTRRDLGVFYEVASAAIRRELPEIQVEMMEDAAAEETPAVRWSRREARSHELLVGLIGRYRGTEHDGKSITQQEYEAAWKANIPRLIFLTEAGDAAVIAGQSPEARAAQEAFRSTVAEAVCGFVQTPDEFAQQVVRALCQWQQRTLNGWLIPASAFVREFALAHAGTLAGRDLPFVGGEGNLATLDAFGSNESQVLLLEAGWGLGKSRLLLEWAARTQGRVMFLRDDTDFTDPGDRVRLDDSLLLVVDDAHKRPTIVRTLIAYLRRRAPATKLLVATRPHAVDQLLAILREQGIARERIQSLELKPLPAESHRLLVRSLVGDDGRLVAAIAQRTKHSPLAAVVAGAQVRKGKLKPAEIEGDDFHFYVIDQYIATITEDAPSPAARERFDRALNLLALVGPIRPGDEHAMEALACFLGIPRHEFESDLDWLEEAHLLSRFGGLIRVPVDAVAEQLIVRAAVARDGRSKGYIEAVLGVLPHAVLNALRNMAGADLASRSVEEGSIAAAAASVWRLLRSTYEASPAGQQIKIADAIDAVAVVYPEAALDFALQEIDRPANAWSIGIELEPPTLHIQEALLRAASQSARAQNCVNRASDLLWRFASAPAGPHRRLAEVAESALKKFTEYDPPKDPATYAAFVAWADRQWTGRTVPGWKLGEYLFPLFSKALRSSWTDGVTVTFQTAPLPYRPVASFREAAIGLLERIGREGSLAEALQAMTTLENALRPVMAFQGTAPRSVQDEWKPEEEKVLAAIASILRGQALPALALAVPYGVRLIAAGNSRSHLQEAAKAVVTLTEEICRGSLEAELINRKLDTLEDFEGQRAQLDDQLDRAAGTLVSESPEAGFRHLVEAATRLLEAQRTPYIAPLFWRIGRRAPVLALRWFELLLAERPPRVSRAAFSLLRGAAATMPQDAIAAAERALREGNADLLLSFDFNREDIELFGDFVQATLGSFLCHPDATIRLHALETLLIWKPLEAPAAWRLLSQHQPVADPKEMEAWAHAVLETEAIELLSPAGKTEACSRFVPTPDLRYWVVELLKRLCDEAPGDVMRLFQERVSQSAGGPYYRPLPEELNQLLDRVPEDAAQQALIEAAKSLTAENGTVRWNAGQWFAEVQAVHPLAAMAVRQALLGIGTLPALEVALLTFDGAEPEYLFSAEQDVVAILELAKRIDPANTLRVSDRLRRLLGTGERHGTPGEPFPRDIALKDAATQAAARHAANPIARQFFMKCVQYMERRIASHLESDEELLG